MHVTLRGATPIASARNQASWAAHCALDHNASERDIQRAAQRIADDLEKLAKARNSA